ncbi:carbamoyltransferase HypF [Lentzea flava]|uniref:Carbamoyltransferase n=1 Tax=Lentzea flava TaxID=103732 RepID=A0ABQ2UT84_9PSEU|nr:carbamoyltransferase HypF [Lentzea flava]MCP2197292.1 hydrogenase maturation protein HypF [Lentzea flava]GGU50157.1 carbamoyltransferase [Lentzea flava]
MTRLVGRDLRVAGVVQGVGFRPYVHRLASRLRLSGLVGNDVGGVFIEIEGEPELVAEFLSALPRDAPARARIDRVQVTERPPRGLLGFRITTSRTGGPRATLVPADIGTCADCLRELFHPADRRYRYPFVNCAHCGPRYTIVRGVPYDRARTTMARFPMCAACAAEYSDPANRRFHAEPTCCADCGPRLLLGAAVNPLREAVARLHDGQVVAIKGLGGFHLAVLAAHPSAAATLRNRKHRPDKPFAVMAADLRQASTLCSVDELGARSLTDARRPIVLLPRLADAPVADAVAPNTNELGVMLPYTPLHHLLLHEVGEPIVLTSGNLSDEPIAHRHARSLAGVADAVLTHDRPIRAPVDDSVVRAGQVLRRARGYAPEPLVLPVRSARPVLACGAELKNTFCLVRDEHAFLSPHIGDLTDHETYTSFTKCVERFRRLFGITPRVVAHDLHPDYRSTRYAAELPGVELVGVQHHHAHVASCLAENGETGPVIGVVFDGTGYGPDGTIWGGEFLVADLTGYRRIGHLRQVPLPGGAAAIRQPWRMAAAYLPDVDLPVVHRNAWNPVVALARNGVNAPLTSSAGRLFDAAAALLDVRDVITYEGQAAIELEQRADPSTSDSYSAGTDGLVLHGEDLLRALVADRQAGVDVAVIAARFHNGLAAAVVACCAAAREETGLAAVALSGGVFQNALLLRRTAEGLRRGGFRVLTHRLVPPNDGGISLGQAAVAASRNR